MIKVQLNQVNGFENVKDYYFVVRGGDECWVEGKDGKVLNGAIVKGYRQIGLVQNSGKLKLFFQHRLFMISFIPNPEQKSDVNHIDGIKSNNLLSNLEWNTRSENMRHADRTGLRICASGEQNGNVKLSDSEIPVIFQMYQNGITQKQIGIHFGVSQMQISNILACKQRSQF